MTHTAQDVGEDAAAAGRRRYPGVQVDRVRFASFLSEGGRALREDAWPELFLVFACAEGDPAALRHFERSCIAALPAALRTLAPDASTRDEVLQALRVRFFTTSSPRILEYQGRGSLEGWVRAAAVRLAIDLRRSQAAARGVDLEHALTRSPAADVEVAYLRANHGAQFKTAFKQAFDSISSRERAVLKLHLVDGASIDQIAELYAIHRSTAARWVGRVREVLRERTVATFRQLTQVGDGELHSLLRAMVSELDFSLRRRLET